MLDDDLVRCTFKRFACRHIDKSRSEPVASFRNARKSLVKGHVDLQLVDAPLPNRTFGIGQFRRKLTVNRDQRRAAPGHRCMFCTMGRRVPTGSVINDHISADDGITSQEIRGICTMFRTIEPVEIRSTSGCDDDDIRCQSKDIVQFGETIELYIDAEPFKLASAPIDDAD